MNIAYFFSGIAFTAFAASALFFLKFWRASRDRFFLLFGGACFLISFERLVAMFLYGPWKDSSSENTEISAWIYLIRLAAFALILMAVIQKNRREQIG